VTNDPALRNDPALPNPKDRTSTDDFSERSFEELVTELERVAMAMDRGEIGIEEAADLYERASALHAAATERLVGVQRRLAELRGSDAEAS
jgi:exodeoxyribonuclease VII small subunit